MLTKIRSLVKDALAGNVSYADALLDVYEEVVKASQPASVTRVDSPANVAVYYVEGFDQFLGFNQGHNRVQGFWVYVVDSFATRSKILAIKQLREASGLGLRDAKDRIDSAESVAVRVRGQ